jgi:Holliday junction resolvase RusA-like endonuclease
VIEMKTIIAGETRKTALVVTVEFPVSVRVEWPEGIPFSNEEAIDAAMGVVSQSMGRDVGPVGKIVWANLHAEVQEEDAEVTEVIVPKS